MPYNTRSKRQKNNNNSNIPYLPDAVFRNIMSYIVEPGKMEHKKKMQAVFTDAVFTDYKTHPLTKKLYWSNWGQEFNIEYWRSKGWDTRMGIWEQQQQQLTTNLFID